MNCVKHGKPLVMACPGCENRHVCIDCIATEHTGHTFVALETFPDKIREKVDAASSENAKIVEHLERVLGDIQNRKRVSQLQGSEVNDSFIEDINKRGEELHDVIDRLVAHVSSIYEDHVDQQVDDEAEEKICATLQRARKVSEKINKILENNTFTDIDEVFHLLDTPYSEMVRYLEPPLYFTRGTSDIEQLVQMIGKFGGAGISMDDVILELQKEEEILQIEENSKAKKRVDSLMDDIVPLSALGPDLLAASRSCDKSPTRFSPRCDTSPRSPRRREVSPQLSPRRDNRSPHSSPRRDNRSPHSSPRRDNRSPHSSPRRDRRSPQLSPRKSPEPRRLSPRNRRSQRRPCEIRDLVPIKVPSVFTKSEFNTFGMRPVNVLRIAGPSLCWVNFIRESWLWLTDENGSTKRRVTMANAVKSIAVTGDGVLACLSGDHDIYKVHADYSVTRHFRIPHLFPRDICIEPGNTILVSLVDSEKLTITDYSQRALARYTSSGERIIMVERDELRQRLFTWPFCVRTNMTGSLIAVVNKTSEDSSHLVILSSDLRLIQRYIGEGIVIGEDQTFCSEHIQRRFHPMDVVFDNDDNFLIAEFYTKTIQLLTENCTRLVTLETFVNIPRSLVYHDNEDIWVGLEDGTVKVLRIQQ